MVFRDPHQRTPCLPKPFVGTPTSLAVPTPPPQPLQRHEPFAYFVLNYWAFTDRGREKLGKLLFAHVTCLKQVPTDIEEFVQTLIFD